MPAMRSWRWLLWTGCARFLFPFPAPAQTPHLVRDINRFGLGSEIQFLADLDGKAFFWATDSKSGSELWVTERTRESTRRVKDLVPGPESNWLGPAVAAVLGKELVLWSGNHLWKSDGTAKGTVRLSDAVLDLVPEAELIVAGDKAFFMVELFSGRATGFWVTDGTAQGTIQLDGGEAPFWGSPLGAVGNRLLLSGDSSSEGTELWVTDGTLAGPSWSKTSTWVEIPLLPGEPLLWEALLSSPPMMAEPAESCGSATAPLRERAWSRI